MTVTVSNKKKSISDVKIQAKEDIKILKIKIEELNKYINILRDENTVLKEMLKEKIARETGIRELIKNISALKSNAHNIAVLIDNIETLYSKPKHP